jgi:DNA (cytosine-5)-methyltransferase 1
MMANSSKYSVVSLFSGCGGLDTGIANVESDEISTGIDDSPFNFVWSNDALEHSCKSLANNFGKEFIESIDEAEDNNVVFNGDVRDVNFSEVIQTDDINLILGGFPCQDFSILRGDENRGGVDVERGKLYMEFARSLADLQPDIFVAENVKGLVSANDGKAYEQIMEDFRNLDRNWDEIETEYDRDIDISVDSNMQGYEIVHSNVVDFSKHGVPQGRERLIIIGVRKDLVDEMDSNLGSVRTDIENTLSYTPPFDSSPLTTMETFKGDSLDNLEDEYNRVMRKYEDYVDKLDSERAKEYRENVWPNYTFNAWEDYKNINNIGAFVNKDNVIDEHQNVLDELGYTDRDLDNCSYPDDSNEEMREQDHVLERLRHIPPSENHKMVKNTDHHVSGMMSNIYKRIHPLKYSPTVIASGGGGTWGYHYERERGKLTNRERARIQTFPEDFEFYGTNAEVRKQIGNAVPPLGAKRVGECIYTILEDIQPENE